LGTIKISEEKQKKQKKQKKQNKTKIDRHKIKSKSKSSKEINKGFKSCFRKGFFFLVLCSSSSSSGEVR
jgi:hypothetical protein